VSVANQRAAATSKLQRTVPRRAAAVFWRKVRQPSPAADCRTTATHSKKLKFRVPDRTTLELYHSNHVNIETTTCRETPAYGINTKGIRQLARPCK
jgi:hypothetical protein